MARRTRGWTCRCKWKNEPRKRKCAMCGKPRPIKKGPKHAECLQGDTYPHFVEVAEVLHGVFDERCCCCGRPKPDGTRGRKRWDREHDHRTGYPRGIACTTCNMLMKFSQLNAAYAKLIWQYLERAEKYPEYFTKPEGHETRIRTIGSNNDSDQ